MASPDNDVAVGYSIASDGTNSTFWSAIKLVEVKPPDISCEDLQTSAQDTTTAHTYLASDINENGTIEAVVRIQADTAPTIGGTAETYTLTYPDAETDTFSGYINSWTPNAAFNELITAGIAVKISGDIS